MAVWIRRRDQPNFPRAMICCFFSSFKTLLTVRGGYRPLVEINVLSCGLPLAGFQVITMAGFGCSPRGKQRYSAAGRWRNGNRPARAGVPRAAPSTRTEASRRIFGLTAPPIGAASNSDGVGLSHNACLAALESRRAGRPRSLSYSQKRRRLFDSPWSGYTAGTVGGMQRILAFYAGGDDCRPDLRSGLCRQSPR